MPRTKGSKNRVTASTDFDAQIVKLQKPHLRGKDGQGERKHAGASAGGF